MYTFCTGYHFKQIKFQKAVLSPLPSLILKSLERSTIMDLFEHELRCISKSMRAFISWSAWTCALVEFRMRLHFPVKTWHTCLPSYWVCYLTWVHKPHFELVILLVCTKGWEEDINHTTQPWQSSPSNIGQLGHFAFHFINLLILT